MLISQWLFINQTGLYRIADTSTIPQINNKHIEPILRPTYTNIRG